MCIEAQLHPCLRLSVPYLSLEVNIFISFGVNLPLFLSESVSEYAHNNTHEFYCKRSSEASFSFNNAPWDST